MRRAAKVDANHQAIRSALRRCGWKVIDLSRAGNGVPDLLALKGESLRLVEVKSDKGKLTAWQALLQLEGWPIHILRSVDDAIALR